MNHPDLSDVNNGALATVRVVAARNESGGYEATDAAFRMAIGSNHTVDNFHAGGIASAVDMETGRLGPASNMGLAGAPRSLIPRPRLATNCGHPHTHAPWRTIKFTAC